MKKVLGGAKDYNCSYDILLSDGSVYTSEGLCSGESAFDCEVITASTIGSTERLWEGTYQKYSLDCTAA